MLRANQQEIMRRWTHVFILGLLLYAVSGETLHFFNHFFPGVTLGIVILIILATQHKATQKYEFSIPFLTYLYAIVPEFFALSRKIMGGELVHASWEDIFLFHVTLDHWLEQTELLLPVMALLLYLSVVLYQRVKVQNS